MMPGTLSNAMPTSQKLAICHHYMMKERNEQSVKPPREVPRKIGANASWMETGGHDLVTVAPRKLARHNNVTLQPNGPLKTVESFGSTHKFTLVVQHTSVVLGPPWTIHKGIKVKTIREVASRRRHCHDARFFVGGRCVGSREQGRQEQLCKQPVAYTSVTSRAMTAPHLVRQV
jgi:hypothetical protein